MSYKGPRCLGRQENGNRGRARAHGATCYAPRGSHQPIRHIHGAGIVLVFLDQVLGRACRRMPAHTRLVAAGYRYLLPPLGRHAPCLLPLSRPGGNDQLGAVAFLGMAVRPPGVLCADGYQSVSSKAWRMGERAPSALSRMPLGFAAPAVTASRMPGRVASSLSSQRCPRLCSCAGAPSLHVSIGLPGARFTHHLCT